jgi:hypothetical protein
MRDRSRLSQLLVFAFALLWAAPVFAADGKTLTGRAAMGDWTSDSPGVRRRITVADLPPPNATR